MSAVSERIGQFFHDGARVEFTEFGSGERWVILIHGGLMTRRMHQPLARVLAEAGNHVVTLDLLGHGRSDRPEDSRGYSTSAWAAQAIALMDHLGADQAVIGGTSRGATIALEVAVTDPERVQGLLVEMPVVDRGARAALLLDTPLLFAARHLPVAVSAIRRISGAVPRGLVPFWAGVVLDTLHQRPIPLAATLHGLLVDGAAPEAAVREQIEVPALVVGHPHDPLHPLADARLVAEELPEAVFVQAASLLEWRLLPQRLDDLAVGFVERCQIQPEAPARRISGG